ncbi:MAG: prolyl aminopeptidase [Alphaproteobacteria bacterium]|nr:prolyl aminopeptidase [Alphaproteobacteria bacterium]
MSALFPPCEPRTSGHLPVGDGHAIYWEEVGDPTGIPVVFLHGGPGSGIYAEQRRFFDPARFRAVLFDQRGAGRSTPSADISSNTTRHLIADIERLRVHLGIGRWIVFGGSWGSTLALAYAAAHPDRCSGLVLRGIWLCRPGDMQWWLYGMRAVFPDHWDRFAGFLPSSERGDLLGAYHRRLNDPDPAVHLPAAAAWKSYEMRCSTLLPRLDADQPADPRTLAMSRIENHYMVNDIFLPQGALLAAVPRLRAIPTHVVHGRYDMICPIEGAFALVADWPEARFTIVPDAGHAAGEPGTCAALIAAMDSLAVQLAGR